MEWRALRSHRRHTSKQKLKKYKNDQKFEISDNLSKCFVFKCKNIMIESTFTRGPLSTGVGIWNRNMNAPEIIRQPPAPDSQEAHDQVEEI